MQGLMHALGFKNALRYCSGCLLVKLSVCSRASASQRHLAHACMHEALCHMVMQGADLSVQAAAC